MKKAQQNGTSLRRAFPHFDRDGDQQISRKELRRGLEDLGIEQASDDKMLQCIFDTLDGDSNDIIDFHEFEHLPLHSHHFNKTWKIACALISVHCTPHVLDFARSFQSMSMSVQVTCTRAEFRMALTGCGLELVDDPQYLGDGVTHVRKMTGA